MNTNQILALTIGLLVATAGVGIVTGERTQNQTAVTEVSSCMIIDEPGTYVLTQDLEPTDVQTASSEPLGQTATGCLVVAPDEQMSEPIIIDGNGHTIDGDRVTERTEYGVARGAGIAALTPIAVRDVELSGWTAGIDSRLIADVEGVTATENRVGLHLKYGGGDVLNSTVTDNHVGIWETGGDLGVFPTLVKVRIADNVVADNERAGIWVVQLLQGIIENNEVTENGDDGMLLVGAEHTIVRGNEISETSGIGVTVMSGGVTFTKNLITENAETGLYVSGSSFYPPFVDVHRNHFEDNGAGITADVIERTEPDEEPPVPPEANILNATNNYWGDEAGPASPDDPDAPFADPETGTLACGDGDTVSEGATPGVSNVRFDPWLSEPPKNVGVDDE